MQVSGTSNNTHYSSHRPTPTAGGADQRAPENLQRQQRSTPSGPAPATGVGSAAGDVPVQRAGPVSAIRRGSNSSWVGLQAVRDGLVRGISTAGTRLLLMTRADLAQAPFHASPEVSKKFLRSLRLLRLHALAAAAMESFAREIKRKLDNSSHATRCVPRPK